LYSKKTLKALGKTMTAETVLHNQPRDGKAEAAAWRAQHIRPRPLTSRGVAALEYAAKGWGVFPVPPGTKQSYKSEKVSGTKWGKTTDPEEINRDFRRWHGANVAIVTGAGSGIFVLEADTVEGHGVDGLASIKALEAKHGPLPATLMAISPSGSEHRYYGHPGAGIYVKNSTSELAPGVDVRGDGGMVVAPPSIKPGVGEYRWLNDLPVADAPAWLLEAVTVDKATRTARKATPRSPAGEKAETNDPFGANGRQTNASADSDLDEIEAALMAIPNDATGKWKEWDEWNRIAMAVYAATGGSPAGFAMFDRWSQKYPGYDADDTEAKWEVLHDFPPTEIGVGTIFYEAEQASPGWRDEYIRELMASAASPATTWANKADNVDLIASALDIFDAAQPLHGSLAGKYLAGLGLIVPDAAHEVLRFHPGHRIGDQLRPCLVALVQDSLTNEATAVQLSALGADATVMDREIIGAVDCYSVIKLGGEPASGELTIAASIEVALAAMLHGFTPAWSVLSVEGIAGFPRPRVHNVKRLTVVIDSDAAIDAAATCKKRWGNVVRMALPRSTADHLLPFDQVQQ